MPICTRVKRRFYQDSLKLMRVSAEMGEQEGIKQAFAFMATEINKRTRIPAELILGDVRDAGADDLVLLVDCADEALAARALDAFEEKIEAGVTAEYTGGEGEARPATLEEGVAKLPANLAVISVPGPYAALQAMIALRLGMNVHLFSDNVTIEEEIEIKDFARKKGLLVMGPDCGTSILSGVPICFANVIRGGNIGVVGASGTGLQEFTCLLDAAGCGITHAIGTGGRDLSEAVEGRTALAALELLAKDPQTEIIAVISKPPSESAKARVIEAVKASGKPAVLAFLGASSETLSPTLYIAGTLEEAAAKTAALGKSQDPAGAETLYAREPLPAALLREVNQLSPTQRRIKGLYTGGTLASEAKYILQEYQPAILDLGDDEYTRGSVHPMIDPSRRTEHVLGAFAEPDTAVLLCDVVIGFGSHSDPAGLLARDVVSAREKNGSHVIVIASVTGTDADPQRRSAQVKKLEDAGIWVFPSNQYAAEVAARIAKETQKGDGGDGQ